MPGISERDVMAPLQEHFPPNILTKRYAVTGLQQIGLQCTCAWNAAISEAVSLSTDHDAKYTGPSWAAASLSSGCTLGLRTCMQPKI